MSVDCCDQGDQVCLITPPNTNNQHFININDNIWSGQPMKVEGSLQSHDIQQRPILLGHMSGDKLEVRCGTLHGILHTRLFICPGIHMHCIDMDGEMITPKQFTVRANKDKQKDWKGSIRVGKSSLRTLMESQNIDFYNHAEQCSAKCQSRNYIHPKYADMSMADFDSSTLNHMTIPSPNSPLIAYDSHGVRGFFTTPAMYSNTKLVLGDISNEDYSTTTTTSFNANNIQNIDYSNHQPVSIPYSDQQLLHVLHNDPISFWKEMQRQGLVSEMIDQMVQSLLRIKDAAQLGAIQHVAPTLSRTVSTLNLQDMMMNRVRNHQWNLLRMREAKESSPSTPQYDTPSSFLTDSIITVEPQAEVLLVDNEKSDDLLRRKRSRIAFEEDETAEEKAARIKQETSARIIDGYSITAL